LQTLGVVKKFQLKYKNTSHSTCQEVFCQFAFKMRGTTTCIVFSCCS